MVLDEIFTFGMKVILDELVSTVVLGVEVGGRWSDETQRFVSLLARAKARCEVWLLRRRAER